MYLFYINCIYYKTKNIFITFHIIFQNILIFCVMFLYIYINIYTFIYIYIYIYIHIHIYIYIYLYTHIYIYIHIYMQSTKQCTLQVIITHRNGFVATHALGFMSRLLSWSHCGDNLEDTLFSWWRIYYAHLAYVRFEHSMCHGSLITTYDHLY